MGAASKPGLRERKRQRTFTEIQSVAIRLFTEQGYEKTTIEQIADEAEVSPSTVFRYFPNKEDLVLSDEYDPEIFAAIKAAPAGESPIQSIRSALVGIMSGALRADPEPMLARGRLMLSVPELRARLYDTMRQSERDLAAVVAARAGRAADDFEFRVAIGALMGALMTALGDWVESDGRQDIVELLDRALEVLDSGLGGLGSS